MQTIIVPLDGSSRTETILPYVRALAHALPAQLHLVHVVVHAEQRALANVPPPLPLFVEPSIQHAARPTIWEREQQVYQLLRQHGESYLGAVAAPLQRDGLHVTYDVHFGAPAACIVEIARQHCASLIAMATHGYSGLRRMTLGSVTDKVLHTTHTPLFVVRADTPLPAKPPTFRRLLVPLDGTSFAEKALPVANQLALAMNATLHLMQAARPEITINPQSDVPPVLREDIFPDAMSYQDIRPQTRRSISERLETVAAPLRLTLPVSTAVDAGRPAEAILEEAEHEQCDLIVMATHGYNGLQRWALGSVADQVIHATRRPVILVRGTP